MSPENVTGQPESTGYCTDEFLKTIDALSCAHADLSTQVMLSTF